MRHARPFVAIAVLALLAATAGCLDPLGLYTSSEEFSYHKDLFGYTGVELHEIETYDHEGTVIFEAWDFSGVVKVEVFDDHDELIYSRTFTGDGGDEYHVDDTADGDEGDWRIELTFLEVIGEVSIRVY